MILKCSHSLLTILLKEAMMFLFQALTSISVLNLVGCETRETVSIKETIVRKLVKPEDISYKDDSVSVISN